jgi:uncharacterized protein YdhG (YjbR/CyaY superfamily)
MKSTAENVDEYIAGQPAEWQPTLKKLRAACLQQLPGYCEAMVYGMPAYSRRGQIEVSFAKQSRYLSLYVLKLPVLEAHRTELAALSLGKGCVRYGRPGQVDWDVVSRLLTGTRASTDAVC